MANYGEDGDTLKLKDSDDEIKISEIYSGEIVETGSYTEAKEKIAQLENQIEELKKALEESSKTEEEKGQELTELKTKLAQTTVTEERMLQGYTAYKNGEIITGTMPNRESVTAALNVGESYTIPEGYHNGEGVVTANSLESQTKATATADNITEGKTAWVNGQLITGNGNDNKAFAASNKVTIVGSMNVSDANSHGDKNVNFYVLVNGRSYSVGGVTIEKTNAYGTGASRSITINYP